MHCIFRVKNAGEGSADRTSKRFQRRPGRAPRSPLATPTAWRKAVGVARAIGHDTITLFEARSRLDRRRFSRPNTHFSAFFKIFKKIIFVQANLQKFCKNFQNFAENPITFCKILQNLAKSCKILQNFAKFCKILQNSFQNFAKSCGF